MAREGFLTDVRTVELFFRTCRRYGVKDYADRMALIRELTRRKKAKYLRDVGSFTEGKRVLKIKPKE